MSRSLYVAASGMAAQQTRLDTVAHNIANVGTTAFKKSNGAFEDLLYQEVATTTGVDGGTSEVGGGVRLAALERDHSQGTIQDTGNELDIAISGRGFLTVEGVDGTPVYTRDGAMRKGADGTLMTKSGLKIAGDIVVPPDVQDVVITEEGTVRGIVAGEAREIVLGELEIAVFENPVGLRSIGGNFYAASEDSGDAERWEPGRDGRVNQGFLEGSNVDVAKELISLIEAQRAYELNSKVVQASDETMQVAAGLKR